MLEKFEDELVRASKCELEDLPQAIGEVVDEFLADIGREGVTENEIW